MRNLKKFLALILAFMMTFSLMVTVNASDFKDDESVTKAYAEAVDVLSDLGVINGYKNADETVDFKPQNNITRGEVAAILYRIVTGDVKGDYLKLYKHDSEFTDVLATDWYAPYVNYCANNGLLKGVGNDRFNPNGNITGYETLVMILRAMGYNNPTEFTNSDWKFKASGYGTQLGLTANISTGSLGAAASRETVCEIMFQGIKAPMVKYSPLTLYTTDLLVDASEVNNDYSIGQDAHKVIYAADVANTLLYQTFKIVGQRTILGQDDFGRPQTEWVKDLDTDTVENGGMYIPNYQDSTGVVDQTAKGKTPDATYADCDTRKDSDGNLLTLAKGLGAEDSAHEIAKTPIKTYKGEVVTECQFTTDVNGNKTITKTNIEEYLNGGKVDTRAKDLDINHTQEGTIGAPGRTTEVYKIGTKFIIVYVDNLLGVVTGVTKRTYDTAGNHVMIPASLTIKVNDAVTVTETSTTKDFTYSVGDLVLLNTYGMKNVDADGVEQNSPLNPTNIQTMVPANLNDFLPNNAKTTSFGVKTIGKPTTENVTVKGTLGDRNHKTGIETDKGTFMANVVYMASKNQQIDGGFTGGTATGIYYLVNEGADAMTDTITTVPSTNPYNYGQRMGNASINKAYTVYKDGNGFVVGMSAAETSTDIGIVSGYEAVRISAGKWAFDVDLFMSDGTEKTVRMLKGSSTRGSYNPLSDGIEPLDYLYFDSMSDASDANFKATNLGIDKGVLVKIQSYTKDGATYYKPIETHDGLWTKFVPDDGTNTNQVSGDAVYTGRADTLFGIATQYDANPVTWNKVTDSHAPDYNVDDDTKFIIAQVDWDYSMNEGNQGGYDDLELSVYTGFKNIPTVTGRDGDDVKFQRIDNTVYVYPEMDSTKNPDLVYTVKSQPTYAVADTYLVYATGATYQNYSVYKALKNGKPVDLNVSNNNLALVNSKIETAMSRAGVALVVPSSTNSRGYVTDVNVLSDSATTGGANRTHTIAGATNVSFDKHGVLYVDQVASHPTDATDNTGVHFLTVDKDLQVLIVNLETGKYYAATQDSVMQYENYDANSHQFVYELNQYGYISTIYIID